MLKDKIYEVEYDSSGAPPTPKPKTENIFNEYFIICPECSSSIEILSINEENNIIEFKCIKENKKYIMSLNDYFEKVQKYKEKDINEIKDKCQIHLNCNYVCYCFECNCHLCNECLKTRTHIHHKKSNLIEINPIKEEINIVKEVINDYKIRLENINNEKKINQKK